MAGARIEIHTDHKNLTLNNFQSMRLLKWRVTLAELCPKLVYKPGEQNIVADGLSRLPLRPSEGQEDPPDGTSDLLQESMLYYPEAVDTFPLEFSNLHQEQNADATIQDKITKGDYVKTTFGNYELVTTKTVGDEQ
jgi:hypothetical protein